MFILVNTKFISYVFQKANIQSSIFRLVKNISYFDVALKRLTNINTKQTYSFFKIPKFTRK